MLLAAFSSRSRISPQVVQTWVRMLNDFGTRSPQALHSCEVNAGGTATTCLPAYAAVPSRIVRNAAQPASEMLLARCWFRTMLATRRSSRELVSIGPEEVQGRRVMEVAALPLHFLMLPLQEGGVLAAGLFPLLSARDDSLRLRASLSALPPLPPILLPPH